MDIQKAKEIIESRTRTRKEVAREIKVSENYLTRLMNGNITKPRPVYEDAIINWAEKQTN